ncbi:MAG: amino acid ABC transporter substrate-binding protein [Desulfobacterales bacterium]|nr:amino acid ABC transporter substrate-binding protein [Desulfobacterales bacterium]MCP4163863.1 amino acid ABC transporter substrate-binding protein [Deltaproteobacteria bacterium]
MKNKTIIIMLSIFFILPFFAFGNDDEVTVCVYDIHPWGYMENGKMKGYVYKISNLIVKTAGYKVVNNNFKPFPRVVLNLQQGDCDFSVFTRNDKLKKLHPLVYVTDANIVIVTNKKMRYKKLKYFKGKTLGIIRNARYLKSFHSDDGIIEYPVKNYNQALQMLSRNRLDGFIGTESGIIPVMKQLKFSKKDFNFFLVGKKEVWVMYSLKNYEKDRKTGKTDALIKAVNKLKKKDAFQNLLKKYKSF